MRASRARLRTDAFRRHPLLTELLLLFVVTAVAAAAFSRGLHAAAAYDEGVYLASADALAHGQKLGSEIFASQPPGFYVLLEAERAVFGGSVLAMRTAMLALALVGCLAAFWIGRCAAGRLGGFFAMALLVSPSAIEDEAVRVRADFPSVALSLVAIALTLFAVKQSGARARAAAVLAGGALAAAVSVKLLAVTAVVPVLAIVLSHRRALARELAIGIGAVAGVFVVAYAGVLGPLWNDAVRFHLDAQTAQIQGAPRDLAGNLTKLVDTLTASRRVHSPFAWLVLLGAVGTVVAARRRVHSEAVALWLWAAVSAAFLAWHRPLWAHDIVMLTAALAVAAGVGLAMLLSQDAFGAKAIAVVGAVVIAGALAQHIDRSPAGETAAIESEARLVRARTPPGSEVASDLPIIPFLAGRRQPGPLIDTSRTRVESGWLPTATVIRAIDRDPLAAVVIGHELASEQGVVRAVRARFPVSIRRTGVRLPGERPTTVELYLPKVPAARAPSRPA